MCTLFHHYKQLAKLSKEIKKSKATASLLKHVIGGMHLTCGIFESIIPRTIDELERLRPRFLIPCHCSGLKAVNEIARNMPNAFIQNSVGTTYKF